MEGMSKYVIIFLVLWTLLDVCEARKPRRKRKHRQIIQTVGCDGVLGSGLVVDKCGVCGGANTDCQIFSGTLDKDYMTIGYHTVVTIPAGAMYVNITELTRSRNYLALEISGGDTIFNGNWRIDYPGNYSAAGTNVMYTRSARSQSSLGEQILIMGPTSVDLDVRMIFQEKNPGIFYEYVIPNPPSAKEERPPSSSSGRQREEGGRQASQQTQPPPTTTRQTTVEPTTTQPTTTPPTTTARTTTRRTTTRRPTTPPPPPPTNPPVQEENVQGGGDKEMGISSGVLPGTGMGAKDTPEGYAGAVFTTSDSEHQENKGSGQAGSYGGSALSGSAQVNNPISPGVQRLPQESVGASRRPIRPGGSTGSTGRERDTIYVPSQSSGSSRQTQTQILRGNEGGGAGTQSQGGTNGRSPPVYVSNPQLGRGPYSGNSETPTDGAGDTGNTQSRPFMGYYPNGYNPAETRVPGSDAIPPVAGSTHEAAQQSSLNRQTGGSAPNPQGSQSNSRPYTYNPNLPSGRRTTVSSGQNVGTTSQSETNSDRSKPNYDTSRTYPGGNYNPQSRLPSGSGTFPSQGGASQTRPGLGAGGINNNPGSGQSQGQGSSQPNPGFNPQTGYGGSVPTGDIVYNPNYRPPTNQGLPTGGGQGIPSRGPGSTLNRQGFPVNGQGRPVGTGQGSATGTGHGVQNPGQGVLPQYRPGFPISGQGTPSRTGQGVQTPGQGINPQNRPVTSDRYPYRPNPAAVLPDVPSQTSSNLPQTSGQIGIYPPRPGQPQPQPQQPSGPTIGQEPSPETNFSPFNSGIPRPLVPIGGEEAEFEASDYSSSVPEEDQGNQAVLGRVPAGGTEPVNQEALYIWMETGVTECSVSCAGGIRETIVQCMSENSFVIADDSMCNADFKPQSRRKACNNDPCPPVWNEGEWTACSRTCGEGRQMRTVTCKQTVTQSITLPVSLDQCTGLPKPDTTQTCNSGRECASWRPSSWGSCSAECGAGEKRRELTCVNEALNEVAESECSHLPRPDETQTCTAGPCTTSWFTSEWSTQCSTECGAGSLSRGVVCSTEGTSAGAVPERQCSSQDKPNADKTCTEASCGPRWFITEWGRCSVECGAGTQSRDVICISSDPSPRVLPTYQCAAPRPAASQPCERTECDNAQWFISEWSECSQTCDAGQRTRHVKCLDGRMEPSTECEIESRPSTRQSCNIQQCNYVPPPVDPTCVDRFTYCDKIPQARLCSYSYYRHRCCRSCFHENNKK